MKPTLALHGGPPVRNTFLNYGKQWLDDSDIASVVEVLKGDYLTQGPNISRFEQKLADYVGARHAVAFCNGTAALHAACYAAGLGPGDEAITTPITFVASANCVKYVGADPVFADIDPQSYNIDPASVEAKISSRTKAIIAVDFTGQPADLQALSDIAKRYNLLLIEDGAHSLGASYQGEKVGSLADMTMFSFHPVKPITTGEGGVMTTNSDELADKLRFFRSHGITSDPERMVHPDEGPWSYEMHELGMNYRMTDLQAVLGSSQLDKLDSFIRRRNELADIYYEAFRDMPGLQLPSVMKGAVSGWHLYSLQWLKRYFKASRKEIFEALRAENIGVHVHYIPVYYHPFYQQRGFEKGLCPFAESWYEQAMTLPIFPKMSEQDIDDLIKAVKKVYAYYAI